MRAPAICLRFATWAPALALLGLVGLAGSAEPAAAVEPCPNEAIRIEQNALGLPDCRAYELVTPGAAISENSRPARMAPDGGAVTYYTNHPAPGAETSAFFYLAKRGASGWSYETIGPQNEAAALFGSSCDQNVFLSPDLSSHILESGFFIADEPALCKRAVVVPGEPDPYRNVFVSDGTGDDYRLVNVTPATATPANARFHDASNDLGLVVFGEEAKLTPEAPAGYNYYVWSEGTVRLLTILPNGSPASGELVESANRGSSARSGFAPLTGAVSSDGRRVFFYSGGGLYMRVNPDQPQSAIVAGQCTETSLACTVRVDASQGPGASGGGNFWRATDSGSTVYFTATSKLTANSTAASGKPDLYRYDVESGQLTDLTVNAAHPADVKGVSGMGGDGSYLYFVANGVLAPGANLGNCPGASASPGSCNLYALHNGSISFIGKITRKDQLVWQEGSSAISQTSKATSVWANSSPSGRYFAFVSFEKLTGYDNTDVKAGTPDRQIFLYDAAANGGAGQLSCASCPPGPARNPSLTLAAAGNYSSTSGSASWMTNAVLDDGSLFFSTTDALLPEDGDATEDTYQFRGGQRYLISVGDEGAKSRFLGLSPDGLEVFFRTAQTLVGRDRDQENYSLYVARIGGGFAEPAPPAPPCESDACRLLVEPPQVPLLPATGAISANPKPKPRCRRSNRRHPCRKSSSGRSGKQDKHRNKHRKGKR